jgi:hypothetical protein
VTIVVLIPFSLQSNNNNNPHKSKNRKGWGVDHRSSGSSSFSYYAQLCEKKNDFLFVCFSLLFFLLFFFNFFSTCFRRTHSHKKSNEPSHPLTHTHAPKLLIQKKERKPASLCDKECDYIYVFFSRYIKYWAMPPQTSLAFI